MPVLDCGTNSQCRSPKLIAVTAMFAFSNCFNMPLTKLLEDSMNLRKIAALTVIVIIAVVVITFASGAVNPAPKVPNVKFVAFSPDSKVEVKEDQTFSINFRVHNYEQTDIANARIITTYLGDSKYFVIDKPDFVISPAIGASNGESGDQRILVKAANLGIQPAIESKFTVSLYLGTDLTDKKEFDVRQEK
jgi:hypothetical protein